jgi:dipeptidyl aminopeptidase/acylaminoacyl peptidase
VLIDIEAATARIASEDTYDTFAFVGYFGSAGQVGYSETDLRFLPGTNEFIWHSETEGWLSLYLNDASTGERKRKLAGGGWVARQVKYLDEAKRELYFTGCGKEGGDPYYQSLYRVHLDTLDIVKLTQETAEHNIRFQPEGGYYIDTFSTIQTAPVSAVYNLSGEKLLDLAAADLSRIEECGYITPEPFEALARDGKTPIYGILIKPYNFDPSKKYPVVDYIYGGSQRINTPKAFEFGMAESDPQGGLQSLAQLGFVGIIVDGFATPLREKAIHDYAYQHAEECCGIEDHVCAIKQLAERFPWIDADKVGIWGASGGGYATARALLAFPEFYKVGVSLCGDHDQAKYHAHWGERWCGAYSEEGYKDQANKTFAKNLEGKLLLIHGDMDDNVHPSATIHLAKALIDENKDFDMLIYPNSHHGVGQFSYVVRRRWDYFVKNLMGEEPPKNFTIREKKEEICGK